MSDPRYVIAARSAAVAESWLREIDLPDAEHVHVTRHPDGTITATPMEPNDWRCTWTHPIDGRACSYPSCGGMHHDGYRMVNYHGEPSSWVDCPTGGDQRAALTTLEGKP